MSAQQVSGAFLVAWLFPDASRRAVEIAAKKQLAERLGVHDEALRLAGTTMHDYAYWVDRLALAVEAGRGMEKPVMPPRSSAPTSGEPS